jgi:hypothetical protein
MRTKPARIFTTFLAVMLCMAAFSVNALAVNDTASVSTTSTPDGTGSVVSDTTNGDGKEFLTIETSDGNVFYLIIDKQKTGDNVYFLDTVTTKDLLSLTQSDSKDSGSSTATTDAAKNTQTSEASSTPGASLCCGNVFRSGCIHNRDICNIADRKAEQHRKNGRCYHSSGGHCGRCDFIFEAPQGKAPREK